MNEVRRLRAARRLFDRAQRDNVTMQEARRRIHGERYEALRAQIGRGGAVRLCGTAAPDAAEPQSRMFWWQSHD